MDDCISRRNTLQLFETAFENNWTVSDMMDALGKLQPVQPEPKWIPCNERLPEKERKSYWVCTDGGYQYECRWTNNIYGIGESEEWGWSIFDIPQYTKVTAWMPFNRPEPYKGEEE